MCFRRCWIIHVCSFWVISDNQFQFWVNLLWFWPLQLSVSGIRAFPLARPVQCHTFNWRDRLYLVNPLFSLSQSSTRSSFSTMNGLPNRYTERLLSAAFDEVAISTAPTRRSEASVCSTNSFLKSRFLSMVSDMTRYLQHLESCWEQLSRIRQSGAAIRHWLCIPPPCVAARQRSCIPLLYSMATVRRRG